MDSDGFLSDAMIVAIGTDLFMTRLEPSTAVNMSPWNLKTAGFKGVPFGTLACKMASQV